MPTHSSNSDSNAHIRKFGTAAIQRSGSAASISIAALATASAGSFASAPFSSGQPDYDAGSRLRTDSQDRKHEKDDANDGDECAAENFAVAFNRTEVYALQSCERRHA
jgi:hypothetical protein